MLANMQPNDFVIGEIYKSDFNDGTKRYIIFQFTGFENPMNFAYSWGFDSEGRCCQAHWGYRSEAEKSSIYSVASSKAKTDLVNAVHSSKGNLLPMPISFNLQTKQKPFLFN